MSARLAPFVARLLAAVALLAPIARSAAQETTSERWLVASDEPGNRLVMLSTVTGQIVGTIPVGARPRGMTLSPDGRRIFVALGNDDAVAVVDVTSRHVVRQLAVGKDPEQVAVSPAQGTTVYVSNEETAMATAVDVATHRTRFAVPVGKEPEGVAVAPNGRKVYVTGEADSSVTVIDAASGRRLTSFAVGSRPRFVVFTHDGVRAYVSAENGGTVTYVDARADTIEGAVVIGDRTTKPTGLALSPDEKTLYVANGRSNEVVVIDIPSRAVTATVAVGERPWGIALSRDGRTLYTANGRGGSVSVIDVASRRVTSTLSIGGRPYSVLLVP